MALITNPAAVVRHIIHKEVQHDSDEIAVDTASYDENIGTDANPGINDDIDLAFTVHDKQINSKKLIEDIASNSRLIPYIKDNTLFFQGINPAPSPELTITTLPDGTVGDVDMYIESSDIVSYTNKRTAPEKVYTKVIVNYHYDYALKDFTENTLNNSEVSDTATDWFDIPGNQHEAGALYDITNLGLKAEQDLPFDAHYIRDKDSAEALQEFLLLWHCNQHNILKLRLPLKYIQLKIGDYIGFDKLINGVKLFGEDYSIEFFTLNEQSPATNVFRNGQQILPVWMVTSTNKTLTHIDVEMIQMHNCSPSVIDAENVAPEIGNINLELLDTEGVSTGTTNIVLTGTVWFAVQFEAPVLDEVVEELEYTLELAGFGDWNGLLMNEHLYGADLVLAYVDLLYATNHSNNTLNITSSGLTGEIVVGFTNWWIQPWMDNTDIPDGSYLNFPQGLFHITATDPEGLTHIKPLPEFRAYKNYNPAEPVTVEISYVQGWNLIGMPLEVEDNDYQILFPDAVSGTLYGYDGTYYQEATLEIGTGYWLRFNNAGSVTISGTIVEPYGAGDGEYEIELTDGWNLISGLHHPINVTDIADPDGIIVENTLFGFIDGGYVPVEVLEVGQAYWIRASQDGTIGLRVNP